MRRWQYVGWLALAALVATTMGCMTISDGEALQEEVAALEARQTQLEADADEREATMQEMIDDLETEIVELESVMEDARRILARDSADLEAELAATQRHINELRGQLEEMQFRHRQFAESFDTFRRDMDRRFDGVEAGDLLEQAETFREEGELDLARRALEHFVSEYDDHDLIWEARLALGEVYFDADHWRNATAQFQELLDDPTSEARQARAARRIGEIFVAEERCDEAKIFFEIVVEDYPGSEEVEDAQRFISEINAGQCGQ